MARGVECTLEEVQVSINAERPRRGVFEVRVGNTIVVSTGPEPRPFPALKALDIDAITQSATKTARALAGSDDIN